eukprot:TRINITY_DN28959_c0_g1_i1.p1 TRINITY_DN28959_c0_g1~~TRINITY_DN28959_c0_g1_i1.p1  ORF type:complete len:363 (-),score=54.81 TRINITY_DN28959_c0_g1_i1:23-1081(-)
MGRGGDGDAEAAIAVLRRSLEAQPSKARIALVTFQGSMCPVTLAHVEAVLEARRLLLGKQNQHAETAPRPRELPIFDLVLAFIGINNDEHVSGKFGGARPSDGFMPANDRRMLVDLATSQYEWMTSCNNIWNAADKFIKDFPQRSIVWYELDGADVALRSRTWNKAWDGRRYACAGRIAAPGQDNGTEAVLRNMEADGKGVDSDWYQQGCYLLLPELPNISSSKARSALKEKNIAALSSLLHPEVATWALSQGPWASKSGQARIGRTSVRCSTHDGYSIACTSVYLPLALAVARVPRIFSTGKRASCSHPRAGRPTRRFAVRDSFRLPALLPRKPWLGMSVLLHTQHPALFP